MATPGGSDAEYVVYSSGADYFSAEQLCRSNNRALLIIDSAATQGRVQMFVANNPELRSQPDSVAISFLSSGRIESCDVINGIARGCSFARKELNGTLTAVHEFNGLSATGVAVAGQYANFAATFPQAAHEYITLRRNGKWATCLDGDNPQFVICQRLLTAESSGLSVWQIVGIIGGSIGGLLLLGVCIVGGVYLYRRRKAKKDVPTADAHSEDVISADRSCNPVEEPSDKSLSRSALPECWRNVERMSLSTLERAKEFLRCHSSFDEAVKYQTAHQILMELMEHLLKFYSQNFRDSWPKVFPNCELRTDPIKRCTALISLAVKEGSFEVKHAKSDIPVLLSRGKELLGPRLFKKASVDFVSAKGSDAGVRLERHALMLESLYFVVLPSLQPDVLMKLMCSDARAMDAVSSTINDVLRLESDEELAAATLMLGRWVAWAQTHRSNFLHPKYVSQQISRRVINNVSYFFVLAATLYYVLKRMMQAFCPAVIEAEGRSSTALAELRDRALHLRMGFRLINLHYVVEIADVSAVL